MKHFMVLAALFFGSCLAFQGTGWAQSADDAPASKEDVQKYLDAVHSHEMMRQTVEAMAKPAQKMAHEQCAKYKDSLPADCEARMNKNFDEMIKQLPFDEMMDAAIPSYEKHFTKGEVDALTAFYSSPTGQKILREMPVILAESMESMTPIVRRAVDRMTEQTQQQVAQMMKAKNGTGTKDSPTKN